MIRLTTVCAIRSDTVGIPSFLVPPFALHFRVDGTLIQAWASQKSFRSKDGSDDGDGTNFHGQKRSNKTHESTTDADARLYKKS